MTPDEGEAEDVTGLFRKFGGDAKAYREFEPAPEPEPDAAWALVPGARSSPPGAAAAPVLVPPIVAAPAVAVPGTPAVTATAPPAAAVPAGALAAARAAPGAPAAPASTPAVAHAIAASTNTPGATTAAPRELDRLFSRLAGQPAPGGAPGQGLMSRWRRPS